LKRAVRAGGTVGWADVAFDPAAEAVQVRREMEASAALGRRRAAE
jgi:hypothetical protein